MAPARNDVFAACLLLTLALFSTSAFGQSALRSLPTAFAPGEKVTVRLDVTPPEGATNWSVHEVYPVAWNVFSATNASATNDLTGELIFGPYNDAVPRSFTYTLATLFEATTPPLWGGSVSFGGQAADLPIAGGTTLTPVKGWEFAGPQVLPGVAVSGTAQGAGRWVATSYGWATTSLDGKKWTYPRADRSYLVSQSRLAYLDGKFLWWGGGDDGNTPRLAVSANGLSWKQGRAEGSDPVPDPFRRNGFVCSVAFGNGIYVAAGSHWEGAEAAGGAIWRSTNGYQWTRVYRVEVDPTLVPADQRWINLEAVSYGDGKFMAVGSKGTLVSSSNGIDWVQRQPLTDPGNTNSPSFNLSLTGILYGPNGWLVTSTGAVSVLRSAEGLNWAEIPGNNFPGGTISRKGGFYRSFHADGKYWFTGATKTLTTVDGTTWQTQNLGAVTQAPAGVTPRFLAGTSTGQILSSADGTTWTVSAGAGVPTGSDWPNHQIMFATASERWISGIQAVPAFLDSNRPVDDLPSKNIWAPAFEATSSWVGDSQGNWVVGSLQDSRTVLGDYIVSGSGYFAVGSAPRGSDVGLTAGPILLANHTLQGGSLSTQTRTLTNALKYEGLSADWGWCKASLCKTPAGFDLYAEAGKVSDGRANPTRIRWGHFSSPNGTNWTPRTVGLNNATDFPGIRGLAWGASRFVAVGEGSSPGLASTPNRIYTSTDGENYSPVNLSSLTPPLDTEGLTSIAFGSGAFIAVGNQGRILFSTNGLAWETVRPSDGKGWNRIRSLNNSWAVVGNFGRTTFSSDGRLWGDRATGVEADLNDVAMVNGLYTVAGNNGMVLDAVLPPPEPTRIASGSLRQLANGSYQFTVLTQPNVLPIVEAGSDLVQWDTIVTTHTPVNGSGVITFTDASAAGGSRFYRVRLP